MRSDHLLAVLIVDPERSDADRAAMSAFLSATDSDGSVVPVMLDLGVSRNRAAAAPLQALAAPTLACISPAGIIVSHDEGTLSVEQIRQRIALAVQQAPRFDQQFAVLKQDAASAPGDDSKRQRLSDFLLAQHNDREAIGLLDRIAHDAAAQLPLRINAWVQVGKAHLRIGEPEKARHAAEALIAELGPRSADAIAGGNLVRGLQDIKARRYERARQELTNATSAAPQSPYAREAAAALSELAP